MAKIEIKEIKQTKTNQNEVRVKLTLKRKDSERGNVSCAILTAKALKLKAFMKRFFFIFAAGAM